MYTGTQLSSVFEGMRSLGHDTLLVYCYYVALQNPRTMLRLRRAVYKLELYGHQESTVYFSELP